MIAGGMKVSVTCSSRRNVVNAAGSAMVSCGALTIVPPASRVAKQSKMLASKLGLAVCATRSTAVISMAIARYV